MKTLKILSALLLTAFFCSCASEKARYVESGGARSVITVKKINMADWNAAAAELVNNMLASNAFAKINAPLPLKMKVSRVANRTSDMIDTDLLTTQITIALQNSGKVSVLSDDQYSQELTKRKLNGAEILPDITMSGKIIELRDSDEDTNEVTYVFFLELNYNSTIVWQGQKQIAKQSDKGIFGW